MDTVVQPLAYGNRTPNHKGGRRGPPALASDCLVYARVSTAEQEGGYSIAAQLDLLRSHAQQNGLRILSEFIDAESGKRSDRTNFTRMLQFIRQHGRPLSILVEKTDRLYRNLTDYAKLDTVMKEHGLVIRLVKEGETISADSASHTHLVHGFKVLLAKNYSDNLSEETKKGLKKKVESGQWASCPPFGYRFDRNQRSLVPDAGQAEAVRLVFDLYRTGDYSLEAVAAELNARGYSPRRAAKFGRHSIEWILKNPIYYGDFWWKGEYHKGNFPPIIERETWDQAQKQFRRRSYPATVKKSGLRYLGLFTCSRCGCAVTGETKKGRFIYYHCANSRGCTRVNVREEALEEQIAGYLRRLEMPDDVMVCFQTIAREMSAQMDGGRQERRVRLQNRLSGLRTRSERLYADRLSGVVDEVFFLPHWNGLKAEMAGIERELGILDRDESGTPLLQPIELCNRLKHLLNSPDRSVRPQLAKIVLSNRRMDGVTLRSDYRFPFAAFTKSGEGKEWRGGRDSNPRPPA